MARKKLFKQTSETTFNQIMNFFDSFEVTGITVYGQRFKKVFSKENPYGAWGINLYRGSVWGVKDGKRQRLKHVWN